MEKEFQLDKVTFVNIVDKPQGPENEEAQIIQSNPDEAPSIDFRESDVVTLYQDLGFSLRKVGRIVDRSPAAVSNKLKQRGVTLRPSSSDPIAEKTRIDKIKTKWNENKATHVARTQSEDAKDKRRKRIKALIESDPAYRKRTPTEEELAIRKARYEQRIERAKAERLRLRRLRQEKKAKQYRAEAKKILEQAGLNSLTEIEREVLIRRYDLKRIRPLSYRNIASALNIDRSQVGAIDARTRRKIERRSQNLSKRAGILSLPLFSTLRPLERKAIAMRYQDNGDKTTYNEISTRLARDLSRPISLSRAYQIVSRAEKKLGIRT